MGRSFNALSVLCIFIIYYKIYISKFYIHRPIQISLLTCKRVSIMMTVRYYYDNFAHLNTSVAKTNTYA